MVMSPFPVSWRFAALSPVRGAGEGARCSAPGGTGPFSASEQNKASGCAGLFGRVNLLFAPWAGSSPGRDR